MSATGVGSGPAIQSIRQLDIDSDDRRAAVYDNAQQSLFSVDLDTGDRALLEDSLSNDVLAVDSAADEGHLVSGSLATIDLDTGTRTTVGTTLSLESSMAYDADVAQLAVVSSSSDQVWWLNPDSGLVSTLSAAGTDGVELGSARQIVKDPFATRFIVNDYAQSFDADDSNSLVAVDVSGSRQRVQDGGLGSGARLHGSVAVASSRL